MDLQSYIRNKKNERHSRLYLSPHHRLVCGFHRPVNRSMCIPLPLRYGVEMSPLAEILTSMYNQATNHPDSNVRHTLRNGLTIAMRVDPGVAPDFHLAVYRHKQTASDR